MPNYWKVLNRVIDESDLILEVLDARLPELTRNQELEDKIGDKPLIFVLNKCDLISQKEGDIIKKRLGSKAVFVSTKKYYGIKLLKNKIFQLSHEIKGKRKVGVVGYPNTGKSSLINALSNRSAAGTSAHSGYTKGKQLIRLNANIYLLDTPGVIPYKENDEVKHTLIASTNPSDVRDPDIAAMDIVKRVMEKDPAVLESVYKIKIDAEDEYEILKLIGKATNLLKKGGKVDHLRTGVRVIQDWQRGKLKVLS